MASKKKADAEKVGSEIEVHVILDRSGSMGSNRAGTISGYNEYLKGLRADRATKYWISLTQFDTNGPQAEAELTVSYLSQPLAEVKELDEAGYAPRGGTPLYDAIGEVLRRVPESRRPKLALIITDGEENSSKEFSLDAVKALIKAKEADGWTFVFLGANIDSYRVGASLGTQVGNTSNYQKGMEAPMFAAVACMTQNYASNRRSTGMSSQVLGEQFLSTSAKAAMGDSLSGGIQGPSGLGGGSAASGTFRPKQPRQWTVR